MPWKESFDQPRQHCFANKDPSSQGYGFSSGHVWMWELDYTESWALKNWCFELWYLRRLLRVPWTARRSNQSILKEINHEYSRLISFMIDWLDLFTIQGTLKSLLKYHISKISILWHSAFFILQLSHPYMTTGKTIALTRWTFFGKVMSLLSLKRALCLWGSYRTRPPRRNPSNFTKWGKGWFVY